MAVSLTHTTVATGTDAGNAQIGKTQWNETHTLQMAADRLLGRTTAGTGAVEEITAGTGLTLTAGALAVSKAFPTGDIVGTTDSQTLTNKTINGSNNTITNVSLSTGVTGTLPVANGGTGLTAGTSGGIPYYSSTSALASSGVLAASALMVGGGAGAAPSTITTGTGVTTALGVNTGTAGAFVVNGGALGTPSSGTVTNLTGTASININGTVGATTANTGAFTSLTATSATGVVSRAAATQDGIALVGRGGGTGSWEVILTPTTLSADRTVTFPNSDINFTTGLPVANGGTGATTLTGILKGNGTSAFTAATAGTDYVAPGTTTTFTATQNFAASGITLKGSSTGTTTFASANASATNYTVTFPASTGTVLTTAAAVTVAQGGTGATTLTGILKGNGTSAFTAATAGTDYVAPGGALGTPSSGTVTNLTGTASININGTVGATTANTGAFTSITSTSASGIVSRAAANQDGVALIGRAGGTSGWEVILTPTTLTADRTLTLPDVSGTVLTTGTAVTAAQGGTGQTSYTTGDILYASGTTALSKLAGVATGNALISGGTGTAPSWGKIGLTTHVSGTLAVGSGGTGATTLTGVLKGNGTSAFTAATAGTDYVIPSGDVASVNGYKCYGGAGTANASGDLTVTFPVTFSATSTTGASGISTTGNYVVVTAFSTTSMTLQVQSRSTGAAVGSAAIRWTVVGAA